MPRSRQILCAAYAAIAVLALVGTWTQNVAYLSPGEGPVTGFVLATGRFWTATLATPASISIAVDLALFFVAAAVLMVIEARRLAIRWVWLYILLGFLVAISVTFPLFLIARERRLAAIGDASSDLGLSRADLAALVVLAGLTAAITVWTLGQ
jgi:Terpene cyclase DEP1